MQVGCHPDPLASIKKSGTLAPAIFIETKEPMDHKSIPRCSRPPDWDLISTLSWLAGVLLFQYPFQVTLKMGPGNFGYNILLTAGASILGVIIMGTLARLCHRANRSLPSEARAHRIALISLGAAILLLLLSLLRIFPQTLYWASLVAMLPWLITLVAGFFQNSRYPERGTEIALSSTDRNLDGWSFNGLFWLITMAILLLLDILSLSAIRERNSWELILLISGRIFSIGTFLAAAVLLFQVLWSFFPSYTRWILVLGAPLIPLLGLANHFSNLYWKQPLIDLVNNLTLDGKFNLRVELEAAGIAHSPLLVVVAGLTVITVAGGLYILLHRASLKFTFRIRTTSAVLISLGLWTGAIAQQGLSMISMRKHVWQDEHTTFDIQLGLLRPDPGLEKLSIDFTRTMTGRQEELLLSGPTPSLERTPDVYVVMVETWRTDSVRPEVMPFLSEFAKTECQQFKTTFAGSNCTPVSWYTLFHSRVGIDWREALREDESIGGFKGSYPLRLLHKLGYRFSVRAVCDLSYKKMCDLNFGRDHKLADRFLDAPMLPGNLDVPEREVIIMDDLKRELEDSPKGGKLHFISLDSAHYNYYWPSRDFTPIHEDCSAINFSALRPTVEQIREVVKRYENAVNWIDRQMEDFIKHLKSTGRYENSVIILTGDHGEEFQENGSWFHCSSLRREQVEVPIMIRWPKWVTEQPDQDLVSHMDIMPSLLDALGLDPRYFSGMAGYSVLGSHPGEALLSTRWPGKSGIGLSLVANGKKANFKASKLWLEGIPETIHFMGWTDFADRPLDPEQLRTKRSYTDTLKEHYRTSIERHFERFHTSN